MSVGGASPNHTRNSHNRKLATLKAVPMATQSERSYIKGLKVDQLKEYLLNHDDVGEDYKGDIEKLAGERYNGKQFLKLDKEKLDNDLEVSKAFRDIVLEMINITEETDNAGVPDAKKPRIQSPSSENNFFFCMTGYKNLPAKAHVAPSLSGASIPLVDGKPAVWSGYNELRVRFLYDNGVNAANYDTNELIKLANTWHDLQPSVPQFRLARDDTNEQAEIRVNLNVNGTCHSCVGIEAESITDQKEATMELDVHTNITADEKGERYKNHLVIHEFGHALGLRHEHQRSDFWNNVRGFIDIGKMKTTIRARFKELSDLEFEAYWIKNWAEPKPEAALVVEETVYDRHSVMHYWFLEEWFDWEKYESKRGVLTSEVKTTMDAIKDCKIMLADRPSNQDIGLLRKYYGAKDRRVGGDSGPPDVQNFEDLERIMTENDIQGLMSILGNHSNKWDAIGGALKFLPGELNTIGADLTLMVKDAPRSYLKRMLELWVMWPNEEHDIKPNLSSLCKALRSGTVGLGALAIDVEKSFGI